MKKHGVLNREIASVLAHLGHTDTIVIADCGLPIPAGVPCIDVSLRKGLPSFLEVLTVVLDDMETEAFTIAEEMTTANPELYQEVNGLSIRNRSIVSHESLKQETKKAKVIIRTGEATPYANIILHSGVIF